MMVAQLCFTQCGRGNGDADLGVEHSEHSENSEHFALTSNFYLLTSNF